MRSALAAGCLYFALVFAAGFALGTLRVLLLAPALGETGAVTLELPLMLAISWLACGLVLRRLAVPATVPSRLAMGAIAAALLIGAETALGVAGFGRTLGEQLATIARRPPCSGFSPRSPSRCFRSRGCAPAEPPQAARRLPAASLSARRSGPL